MWLLALNGLVYLVYGIVSGHLRRKLTPLTPAAVLHDCARRCAAGSRTTTSRVYNAAQRAAYLGAIVLLVVLVLSGLVHLEAGAVPRARAC